MNQNRFPCPYCGKILKTDRGRTQHINQSPKCSQKQQEEVLSKQPEEASDNSDPVPRRRSKRIRTTGKLPPARDQAPPLEDVHNPDDEEEAPLPLPASDEDDEDEDKDDGIPVPEYTDLETEEEEEEDEDTADKLQINTEMRRKFFKYLLEHEEEHWPLTRTEETQIRLLDVLMRKKAPLNAYKEVLEWHLKEANLLAPHETLKHTQEYTNREAMMKKLIKRYNLEALLPVPKVVGLPFAKANVVIPCTDVQDAIVSLLTDPRFEPEDYLFFGDDPRAKPPEQMVWLEDLNTGDAHLRTYETLVTDPQRQVLLPIVMYMDGATTGQFSELPVTALKIALGIHKRSTRDKGFAWRSIAYIPQVRKQEARGKKLFKESGHLDSQHVKVDEGEGDSGSEDASTSESGSSEDLDGAPKAQDLHSMLRVALKSFVKLQKTGFIWDLVYKKRIYEDIEFIPYVIFVKCDTEEGDLLCGKYLVRSKHVAHVCRYCHCPMDDADNPLAKYKPKTPKEIQKLVLNNDLEALKAISQQNIRNAWYKVQFHRANERGIHGAAPSEMLHAMLLGTFKYIRDIFFDYMGKSSALAENMDGLAKLYGKLISRQSDRDLPNTNFNKGIRKGKLMAKQYRGVLLNMAAILACTKGRKMLFANKKFGGSRGLKDWTLLVELMLEWEAFLNQKRMKKVHVRRLARKHRFIMYIMSNVAKRSSGMGLKLMKFHAIVHLVDDMLLYGVPTEFDTGSNESHHKPTKQAAKLTQRNEATFNMQTGIRLVEFLAIELAIQEISNDKKPWDYFAKCVLIDNNVEATVAEEVANAAEMEETDSDQPVQISNGGTKVQLYRDKKNNNKPSFKILGGSKFAERTEWEQSCVDFLTNLEDLVSDWVPALPVFTEHKRDGVMFRGHPNHRGTGPWQDWVQVDWDDYGVLPSRIWCFVKLIMPKGPDTVLEYGGISLTSGTFAVVEVAEYEQEPEEPEQIRTNRKGKDLEPGRLASDLFVPLLLEIGESDVSKGVINRKFYLANTDAFVASCCVVPDVGGEANRYFLLKSRSDWVPEFVNWLEAPHDNMQTD